MSRRIAVLSVQGAFIEHEKRISELSGEVLELRKKSDLLKSYDGIILPGGESSVQGKLIRELGMLDVLKEQIEGGMPVLATCAGMILLAKNISNDSRRHLGTMPITVKRNAYGRQIDSFFTEADFGGLGKVPMEFIRAPYIEGVEEGVEILSSVDGNIVAVQYGRQLAMSFHPELCGDTRIHEYFLSI